MSQLAYILVSFMIAIVVVAIPLLAVHGRSSKENLQGTATGENMDSKRDDALPQCC